MKIQKMSSGPCREMHIVIHKFSNLLVGKIRQNQNKNTPQEQE
uniref:Uncharacterized protein n=1 Tax=Rhizophora mucronata TaxID=61149 RepID=A0A2P2PDK2_RHIMU